MGKQAQHVQYAPAMDEAGKRHARQRSHEGDSEIRLPGSLDESKPLLRRNVTSHELGTRNKSSTKLKKNLSHGQLTRLASGKNLVGLVGTTAPPSPGLKAARKGRAKSEEVGGVVGREKDLGLHEQEVELGLKRQERKGNRNLEDGREARHVGFAVGSADGEEESEDMDLNETPGSGLQQQEDEWTDNSASASPLSTRINTANNSRRPSMMAVDHKPKPPDEEEEEEEEPQHPNIRFHMTEVKQPKEPKEQVPLETDATPEEDDDTEEDMPSPKSMPAAPLIAHEMPPQSPLTAPAAETQQHPPPHIRSPLHAAKDYPPSVAKRLTSAQLPAPALVSNVTALDDIHSTRGSPAPSLAPSLRSTRSINGGHDGAADQEDEQQFISKFLPSSSHPSTGSGANTTAMNTPKIGSFQAPTQTLEEEDPPLSRAAKSSNTNGVGPGPASPQSSTRSSTSGTTTPSFNSGGTGRSRFELQLLKSKALSDREAAAELKPDFPHHKYDRRNESLKSYLNLIALGEKQRGLPVSTVTVPLGPEIFQGRFKAVNVELKVVQQYRDPIAESVRRLRGCEGGRLGGKRHGSQTRKKKNGELKSSKSAVTLPSRIKPAGVRPGASKLSTSASPPKGTTALGGSHSPLKVANGAPTTMAKSAILVHAKGEQQRRGPRRGVSFAGAELTETREFEREEEVVGPDEIARGLWEGVGV
ncbi:hypothetical protein LTR56_008951 [Elasticomyces elasticus]|nr:hypothetical protein LTR56_008951 [Elasticomyces elasticus]KAK3663181.1 hypothetical protein LTR22_006090 [Elasticomyces elasticus]KAK4924078.1 hypothetical protein LTR49_008818 [Elasticomyces elasticus]KAK5764436.1 hypothetical protein LTS12_005412 [Elasticomyces elasticus]